MLHKRRSETVIGTASVPFSIGCSKVSQLFNNSSFDSAAGSFRLTPLPNFSVNHLKHCAIRDMYSRLEIQPQNELAVNFDFSGVCDVEEDVQEAFDIYVELGGDRWVSARIGNLS